MKRLAMVLVMGLLRSALADEAPPAQTHPGFAAQAGGLVLIAVGIAGVAAGIGAGLRAGAAAEDITFAAQTMAPYDAAGYRAGKTYEAVGMACDVIGAVALVGGVVMLLIGYNSSTTSFAPKVAPGRAGTQLTWSFQ